MKSHLKSVFVNSEVYFSEDPELRSQTAGLGRILDEEAVHATIADCILILDVSRGANVEVDRFSSIPKIASKITVIVPERYAGTSGLVSEVYARVNVVGFTDDELDRCAVVTEKAVAVVRSVAIHKKIGG